jgi:hypothetical protein
MHKHPTDHLIILLCGNTAYKYTGMEIYQNNGDTIPFNKQITVIGYTGIMSTTRYTLINFFTYTTGITRIVIMGIILSVPAIKKR